jgi:hypothetical protein
MENRKLVDVLNSESNPEKIRKRRIIIYLRVSTDEQSRSGFGLDRQIKSCLEYVHKNGFELAGDAYLDAQTGLPVVQQKGRWVFQEPELVARYKVVTNREITPVPGYMDDYTGTVPIEDRPQGKRLFDLLRSGEADGLVVEEIRWTLLSRHREGLR